MRESRGFCSAPGVFYWGTQREESLRQRMETNGGSGRLGHELLIVVAVLAVIVGFAWVAHGARRNAAQIAMTHRWEPLRPCLDRVMHRQLRCETEAWGSRGRESLCVQCGVLARTYLTTAEAQPPGITTEEERLVLRRVRDVFLRRAVPSREDARTLMLVGDRIANARDKR